MKNKYIEKTLLFTLLYSIQFTLYAQPIQLIDSCWNRTGPYCADVHSLAIAPSNSNIIYLGTYSSGIYKTTNGGESWTYCSIENLPTYEDSLNNSPCGPCWWYGDYYPIEDIAVDPDDADHLWIGTAGRGLYESNDGGNSWQKANASLPDTLAVNYIHINKQNPDDIFLGTGKHFTVGSPQNGGLYRTINGGANWQLIEDIPHANTYYIAGIQRDPIDENHLFVGVNSAGEPGFSWGLLESYDNGNNWQICTDNLPIFDLSINPEDNQNLWGIVLTDFEDWLLLYSEDGGQTWNLYEGFENPYLWVKSLYTDTDFNLYITRHTEIEELGFIFEILKSEDNGNSWFTVDIPNARNERISLSNRCEADKTNTDNVYFGTYYGVYHSDDGGITTQLLNTGLYNSYIYDVEVNPNNSEIIYAGGTQGFWRSMNGGKNWNHILDKEIFHIEIDPKYPDTLYFGSGKEIFRSHDGGLNYENIYNNLSLYINDISIDPKQTNIIYVATGYYDTRHVYKSLDFGNYWSKILSDNYGLPFTKIIIDPIFTDTLYYGRHRSIDGGISWDENILKYRVVGVHPYNSDILYGTGTDGNELFISYDWGASFQLIDEYFQGPFPGYNIRNFTISKDNPDFLFYCTLNDGIHYSADAGESWQQLEGSYEKRTLDIVPLIDENKFYIATHGDGVWVYDTTYVSAIKQETLINNNKRLKVFPNPFNYQTRIYFKIKNTDKVNIKIYDLQGRLINTLINENKNKGLYEIIWKGKDLNGKEAQSGLYFICLQSGREIHTCKVVYIK